MDLGQFDVEFKVKGVKSLIKDGEFPQFFIANGVKYKKLPLEQAFSFERVIAYYNLRFSYGYERSLADLDRGLRDLMTIIRGCFMQKNNPTELIAKIGAMHDGMYKNPFAHMPKALALCTLCIVREGEDISKWDAETQKTKLEDWAKEYNALDFLALGHSLNPEFLKLLKQYNQEQEEEEKE